MSPFTRLSHVIARRPVTVLVVWGLIAAVFFTVAATGVGPYGSLEERTATGPPEVKGSDSYAVAHTYNDALPDGEPTTISLQVLGADPSTLGAEPEDPEVAAAVMAMLEAVAAEEGVIAVQSPFGALPGPAFDPAVAAGPVPPGALTAQDTDGFLALVWLAHPGEDELLAQHQRVEATIQSAEANGSLGDLHLHVFSTTLFFQSFEDQLQQDLVTGEAIAIPLALLVMVLVFGGFLAASTPITGALASISGGFAVVYGFTFLQDMDSAAQNVVTVLGIGLCIDYGLLIVSRFREETSRALKASDADPRRTALTRTMETAGRTVFFSGITVAIAVSGLLYFTPEFLTGFGGASLGVVVTAVAAAITLVPAIAYLYGERIARPGVLRKVPGIRRILAATADVERDEGMFSSLAARVQRRPWVVLVAATAVLLTLAAPALSLTLRNSEGETLPADDPNRVYLAAFEERFPAVAAGSVENAPIHVMADTSAAEFDAWSGALLGVPGVTVVTPALALPDAPGVVFAGLDIVPTDEGSPEAVDIVHELRALDAPFTVYVGGQAANQVDFIQAIKDGMPVALAVVVGATFLLLFLMTGSVLVPLKALLINVLSLTASVGILVAIFQYGWFDSLLGIDSLGGIETYVVVLVVSFGFGLAMDYEVFLLARIKELVDKGYPNDEAVRLGLQRSGRIITSAAAIIILVFLGFAAGKVLIIKEIGVGLAIAVLLDATLVRMLLVPATMTLLGNWNWWAPKALRGLYAKMSTTH